MLQGFQDGEHQKIGEVMRPKPDRHRSRTRARLVASRWLVAMMAVGGWWTVPRDVSAATKEEIRAAIEKGGKRAQALMPTAKGGTKSLLGLAVIKAGIPHDVPEIQEAAKSIREKIHADSGYEPTKDRMYEPGIDLYFLAEADPERYRPEIEAITKFLLEKQYPGGSWDYHVKEGGKGDTSVTQYCCLGLWAAARAGIRIDPKVWEKVINWHVANQNQDGGFGYVPGVRIGHNSGGSTINMGLNAIASVHIAALQLDPSGKLIKNSEEPRTATEKPRFGVLERVEINDAAQSPDGGLAEKNVKPKIKVTIPIPNGASSSARRALGWVTSRYLQDPKSGNDTDGYFFYSIERMASLANIRQIGDHDWFEEIADRLIKSQMANGGWVMSKEPWYPVEADTAFAVLFLSRSTGRLLKLTEPGYGNGVLVGGRGLPDDLSDPTAGEKRPASQDKAIEPLDKLLASLQNTGDINLEDVQEQIVEQVQLGDRQKLVGQVDQLLKLVEHPDPAIRQTAIWALGRSDRLDLARYLIQALNDPDVGVMVEAQNALCWISRKPKGFGLAADPLAALPPDATGQQRADAVAVWHRGLILAWGQWFLDNRPYQQRGDAFESDLRLQMETLRLSGAGR